MVIMSVRQQHSGTTTTEKCTNTHGVQKHQQCPLFTNRAMTKQETENGLSPDGPDRSSKKPKTKESLPPGSLKEPGEVEAKVEGNQAKSELKLPIEKQSQVMDPLIWFTFNAVNTTAAEHHDIFKAAWLFVQRNPKPAGPPTWDAGNQPVEI